MFMCNFSTRLDDLSRKEQGDPEKVIEVLKETGRFSCFEATANATIAGTLTELCKERILTNPASQYPWTEILMIDGKPFRHRKQSTTNPKATSRE